MASETVKKTVFVALGVCLVCSVLVSAVAVSLRPLQEENKRLDKIKNVLIVSELISAKEKNKELIQKTFAEKIKTIVIDLKTGERLAKDKYKGKDNRLNPDNFNIKDLSNDPKYMLMLDSKIDIAKIKKTSKYAVIYLVGQSDTNFDRLILPIYGKGLWSTLYGFIALDKDLKTIKGLTFYQHGETPGLGGEVDNVSWKASWKGKKAFNDKGELKIEVLKGKVDKSRDFAKYQVDGLSGATLTTRGVNNLVRFWLGYDGKKWGDVGYGKFIQKLRKGK